MEYHNISEEVKDIMEQAATFIISFVIFYMFLRWLARGRWL